jgi:WD40 repeat protein
LDIYNLYLQDIYINPANTKTIIKSILEIPEENLVVTGSDTGEVRIFHFNKKTLQLNSQISPKNKENFLPSLKLLHEIKVFDSPIKSMVFLPSREFSSFFNEKNFYCKSAENLKLKYYLVCSCMDGHMSLIDLRNFNEEKIYPDEFKKAELFGLNKDEDAKISNEGLEKVFSNNKKTENLNKNKDEINFEALAEADYNNNNLNILLNKKQDIFFSEQQVEQVSFNQASQSNLNQLLFNSKINTVNLPIYSMVFAANRKTVLFSQGTDIFEFNNFSQKTQNENFSYNNCTIKKSKINLLIPEAHNDEINLLYLIKDKNILVSCSKDNRILLWDFSDPEKFTNFTSIGELAGSTSRIESLCSGYIEGVWHIASLSKEGIVNFWNLENKEKSKTITFPFKIKAITFSGYENIYNIIKKGNGFILFDAFEDQYKEFSNMDKINKDLVVVADREDSFRKSEELRQEDTESKAIKSEEDVGNYKLNIHPNKKIENFDFEKLNLLSLRLMSRYTCGILVGNYSQSLENETDVYYAIFANKLGNLDVWANFDDDDIV